MSRQDTAFEFDNRPPVRGGWNVTRMLMRGRLTDRQIEKYRKMGYYSAEFRDARRELQAKRQAKRLKREGNFLSESDRLIYSPV